MRFVYFIISMTVFFCQSQTSTRFKNEVGLINQKYDSIWNASQETIVFTGSSSIKMWKNIQELFPEYQIINSGFGESQTIDLLNYTDDLILKYKPKKIFIYEGDNDISDKKRLKDILNSFSIIISKIKKENTEAQIILISSKPSIARWHLKRKYMRFNKKLKEMCEDDDHLEFVNVWDIMLENRKVNKELFIDDGLHMNDEGYKLWYSVIKNHVQ
ncbi:GDSL-type esterase/lipase family protein [Mariniflexile rhizosphaerae]|uniref:GDSL-type esterase/lipase family protein n=1 Tax=unclassified Mariniflexile TaxID=2643887 RepID=UPI001F3FBF5A|nr:GDSL-type esterase/lipase family protein [Mariniflexile sp. TRM1-10]